MKNIKYLVLITQVGIDIISGIAAGLVIGMLLDKLFKQIQFLLWFFWLLEFSAV